jgi:hypothetical protein
MKSVIVCSIAAFLTNACTHGVATSWEIERKSERAVAVCERAASMLTRGRLPDAADRAYVRLAENSIWVNFFYGENGAFAEKDPDSFAVAICGVSGYDGRVIYFREPRHPPMLDTGEGVDGTDFSGAIEVLTTRNSRGNFKFKASQSYDPDGFYKHNRRPMPGEINEVN